MRLVSTFIVLAGLSMATTGTSFATTLGFDSLAYAGTNGREGAFFAPYQYLEAGYSFFTYGYDHYYENSPVTVWAESAPYNADPGGATLSFNGGVYSRLNISRIDNAPFNVKSVDVTDFLNNGQSFSFSAQYSTESSCCKRLNVLSGAHVPGLSTVQLGLNNITSLTFGDGSAFQFDNLNVSTAKDYAFGSVIAGGIHTLASGQDMIASFTPNFGFSLSEAAKLGGYDHFNWVQVAEKYPGSIFEKPFQLAPFTDPPAGGLGGQAADNLPFYWDEVKPAGAEPGYLLSDNIVGNTLQFLDIPVDSFVIPGLNYMQFYTSLVGVRSDGTWTPLDSFSWQSDSRPTGGTVLLTRNIDPIAATGRVYDLQDGLDPNLAPQEVRNTWITNGATLGVPEPEAWSMMVFGFLMIGVTSRSAYHRRRAQHQQMTSPPSTS